MTKFQFVLALALAGTTLTSLAIPAAAGDLSKIAKGGGDLIQGGIDFVDETFVEPIDKLVDKVDEKLVEPVTEKIVQPLLDGTEGVIKDTIDFSEDALRLAKAVTLVSTIKDLFEGKPLKESLKGALEDAKTGLKGIARAPMVVNHLTNATTEVTGNVLGKEAGKAVALLKLPTSIASALPAALMETLIATSEKGEDGKEVVGIPLNAALKHAHQYYEDKAQPLPEQVAMMLVLGGYDPALVAKAKYVVDHDTGSVPALVNFVMTELGEKSTTNHAVAVDDIIVFANQPGDTILDLYFWAHEVHHVAQYAALGMDGFAAEYTTNHSEIERLADEAATAVYTKVETILVAIAG